MKYSIIVPAYNEEKNLKKWFERFKCNRSDYEVIIVDDGSSDKTLAIAENIKTHNRFVRVYTQSNQGVSAARNLGLEKALGEWIIFADADDILRSNCLDIFDNYIKSGYEIIQASQISSGQTYDNSTNNIVEIASKDIQRVLLNRERYKRGGNISRKIMYESVHGVYGKLFNKKLLDRNKVRFQEGLGLGEDILFYFDALACTKRILLVNDIIYEIVENMNSSTRSFNSKMPLYAIEFSRQVTKRIKNIQDDNLLWDDMCYQIFVHLDCGVINNLGYAYHMPIREKVKLLNDVMQNHEVRGALECLFDERGNKDLFNKKRETLMIWLIIKNKMGIYFIIQKLRREFKIKSVRENA